MKIPRIKPVLMTDAELIEQLREEMRSGLVAVETIKRMCSFGAGRWAVIRFRYASEDSPRFLDVSPAVADAIEALL